MSAQLIAFYLLAIVAVSAGLGVVLARNVVHAAFLLLFSLLAVAGIFLIAIAEFLALAQVLIYGGAVTVVVLFAIVLTRSGGTSETSDHSQRPLAAIAAAGALALLVSVFAAADLPVVGRAAGVGADGKSGFERLGTSLFTEWAIPFELASLVLLVALIGAILLARGGEGD